MANPVETSGVQELIDQLQKEGVAHGQAQSEALLQQARQEAERILAEARAEAHKVTEQAHEEATKTRQAGDEAVRLAVRDAIRSLENQVLTTFKEHLEHLVGHALRDQEFLKRLILEVTRQNLPEEPGRMEILLPRDLVSVEDLRRNPEEVQEGTLAHFVVSLVSEQLRQGISAGVAEDRTPGLRVQLVDQDIRIDLTEGAISRVILEHLTPRFRAVLEGVRR